MSEQPFVILNGSHHAAHPSCIAVGLVPADQHYQVNILLRRRSDAKPFPDPHVIGALPLSARTYLTIEELEKDYGASEADADAIAAYLTPFGLVADSVDLGKRAMIVSGLAIQFAAAFRTTLMIFSQSGSLHRGYSGGLQVPEDLAARIIAVTGLCPLPATNSPMGVRGRWRRQTLPPQFGRRRMSRPARLTQCTPLGVTCPDIRT